MTHPTHDQANQYAAPQQYPQQYEHPSFDQPPTAGGGFPSAIEVVAAIVIAGGFVISMESSSTSWVDGEVTSFSYTNSAALIAGGLALVLGILDLAMAGRARPRSRLPRRITAVVIIGLGVLHLLRGGGAFAEPPAGPSGQSFTRMEFGAGPASSKVDDATFLRLAESCSTGKSCDEFARVAIPACKREDRFCMSPALYVHYVGSTGKVDLAAARAGLERGCNGARANDACRGLRVLFEDPTLDADAIEFRPVLEAACSKGNQRACTNLSVLIGPDRGDDTDLPRARELAKAGCEAKHHEACLVYGVAIYLSKEELHLARAAFERGCDAGGAQSCWNLTVMLDRGEGGAVDHDTGRLFAKRACELGRGASCEALGIPSPWLRHASHPKAVMMGFAPNQKGFDRKRLEDEQGKTAAEVVVKKDDEHLRVEVTSNGTTVEVGSFDRLAAAEFFVDRGHLFVLVYAHTEDGKITSTEAFRFELTAAGPTPAGDRKGPGRLDWRD